MWGAGPAPFGLSGWPFTTLPNPRSNAASPGLGRQTADATGAFFVCLEGRVFVGGHDAVSQISLANKHLCSKDEKAAQVAPGSQCFISGNHGSARRPVRLCRSAAASMGSPTPFRFTPFRERGCAVGGRRANQRKRTSPTGPTARLLVASKAGFPLARVLAFVVFVLRASATYAEGGTGVSNKYLQGQQRPNALIGPTDGARQGTREKKLAEKHRSSYLAFAVKEIIDVRRTG